MGPFSARTPQIRPISAENPQALTGSSLSICLVDP